MRKKLRTRQHVIADLAVNHVERFVLRCGYTMERIVHDYGLDAAVFTFSAKGELENGIIFMQVKATDHPRWLKNRSAIALRVERRDLVSWIGQRYPVVLVVFDAIAERAYWLSVGDELQHGRIFELPRRGATITLHIPVGQLVSEVAIRTLRQRKRELLVHRQERVQPL